MVKFVEISLKMFLSLKEPKIIRWANVNSARSTTNWTIPYVINLSLRQLPVKTWLRNQTGQERLTDLAILPVHQEIVGVDKR